LFRGAVRRTSRKFTACPAIWKFWPTVALVQNEEAMESSAHTIGITEPKPGNGEESVIGWERVLRRLRHECGESVYNSWFGRLELDDVVGTIAICSVPTKFLKSWIESHFAKQLEQCVKAEFAHVTRIVLNLRSAGRANSASDGADARLEPAGESAQSPARPQPASPGRSEPVKSGPSGRFLEREDATAPRFDTGMLEGSPLDGRFTFDTFLVGQSNQLAYAAAQRVAVPPSQQALPYNPLYVHAGVGMGKTHLLHAVAQQCIAHRLRVVYLTAERFMYGFVSALKAQSTIAYKEWLRTIDLLIIDDLQFLQGKTLQHEFGHTLNALIDSGRQIVIAADRPPADLETIDERIRSRLSGGLCIEMTSFDEALRRKVVYARVEAAQKLHPGIDVPDSVIQYVANAIQTNGRDLEGAVNRLIAHATLTGARLNVQSAEVAISDLVRSKEPRRVKIDDILKLVSSHYNVSRPDILSSRRTAVVVKPRQVAMYLSKVLTLRSLPEIGRRFGGRDHTTVLHAVRKIDALSAKDAAFRDELELLKRMLTE